MTEISNAGAETITRLRDRLLIDPREAGTMLDLAALLERTGDLAGAIDLCQRALRVDPYRADVSLRLGVLWSALGDKTKALPWFERTLAIDPDCAEAADRLKQLAGMDDMTPAYVRTLFDQYADRFDDELTGTLNYRAPELVAAALERRSVAEHSARILDLGCGTGLSGAALRPFALSLDGLDLSPGMIAQAEHRKLYDSLAVAEAEDFLERTEKIWDIVGAVDMLNYVGDLTTIFSRVAGRLAVGGLLAGTLEKREEGGVALTEKRRYAHGADHLQASASAAGLDMVELSEAPLRTEGGAPVTGLVFVLGKPYFAEADAGVITRKAGRARRS